MASNYSLESELKGTTIIAFFHNWGIVVGVDSRGSNEWILQKKNPPPPLERRRTSCVKMCVDVEKECLRMAKNNAGGKPRVSDAYLAAYNHLVGIKDTKKICGAIIVGWDDDDGYQIYRVFIDDERKITRQRVYKGHTSLGTGAKHADRIIESFYTSQKSNKLIDEDVAVDLVLRALFEATFFDKLSGGTLNVFGMNENGYYELENLDTLLAYSKYYKDKPIREAKTLFLVYSTRTLGVAVQAAHLVTKKPDFYLHRIVCNSENEASKVYRYFMENACPGPHPDDFPLLGSFPYRVEYNNRVPVYVNQSSEYLLELMCESRWWLPMFYLRHSSLIKHLKSTCQILPRTTFVVHPVVPECATPNRVHDNEEMIL